MFNAQEAGYAVAVTIDDDFMPDHASNIYARGEQMDVAVIAGTNTDEGTIFQGVLPFNTPEAFRAAMEEGFGEHAEAVLGLYPVTDAASLFAIKNQLITDTWFVLGTRNMLAGMFESRIEWLAVPLQPPLGRRPGAGRVPRYGDRLRVRQP